MYYLILVVPACYHLSKVILKNQTGSLYGSGFRRVWRREYRSIRSGRTKASSYRVRIPLLSVGATKFRNVTTSTNNHPYTLLGVKLLQYGKVTIDYPRGRFYFEAFQPDNEINNQGNNFDLTVKDGDLFVSTVWSSTKGKIAVGDKVVKINGKPAKKYDFCESILNGIPELKEKRRRN